MASITVSVQINDRMTRCQRIIVILRDNPDIRDSYDLIISRYYREYPLDWVARTTIERDIRAVQYDMGIFPPSEGVKRKRKIKQKEIIAEAKERKKGLFARAWDLLLKR